MFLWLILPVTGMIMAAYYLYRKALSAAVCFLPELSKRKQQIAAGVLAAVLVLPALRLYDSWFVILLHFVVFLILGDLIVLLYRKIRKMGMLSTAGNRIYRSSVAAILMTALVCGYGHYHIFQIVRTEYTMPTQKEIREDGYTLVLLSDLHYGITLDGDELQAVVDRINREQADAVILDGDLVDESTTETQMQEAFQILGSLCSTYGTYYVYGNHDKNHYTSEPNYSETALADTIRKAGIRILEDETVALNRELILLGRADRGDTVKKRAEISQLTQGLDENDLWVVLDHQPAEYDEVRDAGCDFILSGHTHAGQIWPFGLFAAALHFDELSYGTETRGQLQAVVTSGIAGWGYPIRTEKDSEYVVLHIRPQA